MHELYRVIVNPDGSYSISPISVNPENVQYIEPEYSLLVALNEGKFPAELDKRVQFSRIGINGESFCVVGESSDLKHKLKRTRILYS